MSSYSIISYKGSELPEQFRAMIFSKWLRSLRFGNEFFKQIDSDSYYKNYHLFIENLLAKVTCKVRLAIVSETEDVVLGFAVYRTDILDYVHVHKDNRKIGIGTKLIPPNIFTITHLTKTAQILKDKKYKDWKFDPFQ